MESLWGPKGSKDAKILDETTLFVHSSYGGDRPSITMYWRSVSLRDNCIDFPLYSIGA